MTAELAEWPDPFDVRRAVRAEGLLRSFNDAGVLTAADVHVALRLGRLGGEVDEAVLLAVALAVRAVRHGSVCVDLAVARETVAADAVDGEAPSRPPWPELGAWVERCRRSVLVADGPDADPTGPLRWVEGLLYLDRYWREEELVRAELDRRTTSSGPDVDRSRVRAALDRVFAGAEGDGAQRLAVAVSALHWVTVIAGGPGTGKTTTVARLLAVLSDDPARRVRVALAAPTGKAAARLQEAVNEVAATLPAGDRERLGPLTASTLHRLLGWRRGSTPRFRQNRDNRLPFDVVVVDETSMVSLPMMARLLVAVRPDARLVLVGDPDQLASVEAGAVLGDLVARPAPDGAVVRDAELAELVNGGAGGAGEATDVARLGVVRLARNYRFAGSVGDLAEAIRRGDADKAMDVLRRNAADVSFVDAPALEGQVPDGVASLRSDVVDSARVLVGAARSGDVARALAALDGHWLLCAHRRGPYGVLRWTREVERWLAVELPETGEAGEWYAGRPLLVTANDYELGLYNGDTGVVVDAGDLGLRAAFLRGAEPVLLAPVRVRDAVTVHAMTVHRSQGSQFRRVSLVLPPADSPLLSRELLYTAVTRAREHVRVIGTEAAVRAAVSRPVVRASGLRRR